jgi:hypothetical protein
VVTFAVGNVDPRSAQAQGATPQSAGMPPLAAEGTTSGSAEGSSAKACSGKLPFTGSALFGPAGLAAGLLTVGGAMVGLTFVRRRRTGSLVGK